MNLLQPYILKLLQTNDCVVIPSFGAFIAREVSAFYDKENQEFVAPGRELSFNVLLTEDDGLLINYIANYKKLSYVNAKQFVKDQVVQAQKVLHKKGAIKIEGIGTLMNDSDGRIHFKSSIKRLEQLSLYGFQSSFTFTEITVKSIKMDDYSEGATKNKLMYRIAAGVVAAVVIVGIILLFPDTKGKHVQTAGYTMPDAIETIDSFASTKEEEPKQVAENIEDIAQNNVAEKETTEEASLQEASTREVKETIKILREEDKAFNSNPVRYYHVIIGSVASNKKASKIADRIVVYDGVYASVLDCGKRFRIVNKTFTSRKRAFAYCNAFIEENPKFKDAWVYVEENR